MAPRKNYTPDQMEKAVQAVINGEKVAVAAQRFGVPRITLHDKVTGKTAVGCAMGPSTVLSKSEEEILEKWLISLSEKHTPLTKDSLLDSVQRIISNQGRINPFTNNRPSKKWFQSFMKRHPNLSQRVPDNLSRARDNVSEHDIRSWFSEIDSYLDEHNLKTVLNNPRSVFNTDESAFFLSPKPDRVIVKKGERHPYSSCGDEKDNLTVLITGNAAGDLAPPMLVFNYERIPASIAASVPDEWGIGKSESGWMCSSTFYEYVTNVFNPWLEKNSIEKPILLFVDGHKSHLTLHLSNFCSQNGIEIFALYPNSTHILQPMDLSVFRPLKAHWKKAVMQWKMENLGANLRKENFAPVLQKALANITKDCIKNGFRAGGLFPFGPDYIDISKIKQRGKEISTKTDPAGVDFFKYLEKEIINIFSVEKLNLFNKLYFENRNSLENNIADEDVALYMIWAKSKSETGCNLNSSSFDILEEANTNIITEKSNPANLFPTSVDVDMLTGTKNSVQTENLQKNGNSIDLVESISSTHNLEEAVDAAVGVIHSLPVAEKDTSLVSLPSIELPRPTDFPEVTSDILVEQSNVNTNIDTSIVDQSLLPTEMLSSDLPKTTEDLISHKSIINAIALPNTTPQKNSMETVLGMFIPSPFNKSLFWPENMGSSKKKTREKVPSTVTSKAWKEYHEKREAEKNKKMQEKEERAKKRMENKKLKEQLANDKKNKVSKKKTSNKIVKKRKIIPEDLTSDSDMEITYAESDVSYDANISLDSDSENLPLSILTSSKAANLKKCKKFSIGSYVIVKYEGEYFPGKVESLRNDEFEINTMTLSTGNTFKWPNTLDKMLYGYDEIIEEIKEPICLNNRGFYRIPEMDKYLPHVYDL